MIAKKLAKPHKIMMISSHSWPDMRCHNDRRGYKINEILYWKDLLTGLTLFTNICLELFRIGWFLHKNSKHFDQFCCHLMPSRFLSWVQPIKLSKWSWLYSCEKSAGWAFQRAAGGWQWRPSTCTRHCWPSPSRAPACLPTWDVMIWFHVYFHRSVSSPVDYAG